MIAAAVTRRLTHLQAEAHIHHDRLGVSNRQTHHIPKHSNSSNKSILDMRMHKKQKYNKSQ